MPLKMLISLENGLFKATGPGGFQTGRGHDYYRVFLLKVGEN